MLLQRRTDRTHSDALCPDGQPSPAATGVDYQLADGMDGQHLPDVLTSLDYNAFLNNHLTHLLHQRQLLDDEIQHVREFIARAGMAVPQESRSVSLPSLLQNLTKELWEDGQPIIRMKSDWYFVLRALAECNILHQDSYSDLLSLLKKAAIPQKLIPTKCLLSFTASNFGQYQTPVAQWKQKGKNSAKFHRLKALAMNILCCLEL